VNQLADEVAVMYAGRIIEQGARQQILKTPSHPYTSGLLAALPGRVAPGEMLHEIQGVVPSPASWPSGCRFRPRCPEAIDACAEQVPTLVSLGKDKTRAACIVRQKEGT